MSFTNIKFGPRKNAAKGFKVSAVDENGVKHKFVSRPGDGCAGCAFDAGHFESLCHAPGVRCCNPAIRFFRRHPKVPA